MYSTYAVAQGGFLPLKTSDGGKLMPMPQQPLHGRRSNSRALRPVRRSTEDGTDRTDTQSKLGTLSVLADRQRPAVETKR